MGKPTGFKEFDRELPPRRPAAERIGDFREIYLPFDKAKLRDQTARCMDCGVPTCHSGCPLGNLIPDWNDLVYRHRWQEAIERLHRTNNFPEFTGRLCPAPCEEACVLSINAPAVTIEQIEKEIIEHAFQQDWIAPQPPAHRTGKSVAIVGSGPSGLACAQQLNRAGHQVTVFEQAERIGGLLRFGIPDFKMEKWVIDRRLALMEAEGVLFKPGIQVGQDLGPDELGTFDATVLCIGAAQPRDLTVTGRELQGIHFAMDFLTLQNRQVAARDRAAAPMPIHAGDKDVVVIGGGDTGSDCIGTSLRQNARSVLNLELLTEPGAQRPVHQPWPYWPRRMRNSSSHEEGGSRQWGVLTKAFEGQNGRLSGVVTVDVRFEDNPQGPPTMTPIDGSERRWPAQLALLAMGFVGPRAEGIVSQLGLVLDNRGNIQTDDQFMTSREGIFAAGDGRRGQSLIVWAISEGREAARTVDLYLSGDSGLPGKGCCDLPPAP